MNNSPITKKPFWFVSVFILIMLVLAACAPAATPTQAPAAPTSMPVATATTETMAATATTAAPMATETTAVTATTAATATVASVPATGGNAAVTEPTIMVRNDPTLGDILVDDKGMTLYMFTKDEPNKSNCAGGCLTAWPPLLTMGSPKAGEGVDASLLGSATMPDGSMIVTYNEMPLYYWQNDKAPGDTTGQDVNDVWYVVSPEGEAIGRDEQSSSASDGLMLNVATDPTLGEFLVDGKGMTLYMFTKDEPNKVNCAGGCLQAWPPFIAEGEVKAGDGVDQSLIGTADMPDGKKIVTYNEMPLYYWQNDKKPGDATGQDVNDVWYVVSPEGEPIGMEGSSSAAEGGMVINVADDPNLGKILVDSKGMTLYMFTKDEPNKVNCAGGCLQAWPPFIAEGEVKAGDGVDQALIGTADMADGKKIVTYNKMPLYYWQGDTKPGDATGQDVNKVWYVVAPDGKPIGMGN